jgi:hypothetical protein
MLETFMRRVRSFRLGGGTKPAGGKGRGQVALGLPNVKKPLLCCSSSRGNLTLAMTGTQRAQALELMGARAMMRSMSRDV